MAAADLSQGTPRIVAMPDINNSAAMIINPSLHFQDRLFWIALAGFWKDWRSALLIVKPETVIKWHRQGFRLYWRWKSKARRPGRPQIDAKIRELIRRFSAENPLWGTPRIQASLHIRPGKTHLLNE